MTSGRAALAIALILLAAAVDIALVRWLRRRREQGRPRERRGAGLPRRPSDPPKLLRPLLDPGIEMTEVPPAPRSGPGYPGGRIRAISRYLRVEVLDDRARLVRLAIALAGLLVSLTLGLRYAKVVMVEGWQLWAWIAAVAATTLALMPPRWPSPPRRLPWVWLGGLLVAAFLLRDLFLETVPGWLHPDEAGLALYTQIHVFARPGLTVNPFVTGSSVQPTLQSYIVALALRLAGDSISSLRLPSVLAGTAAILATYAAIAAIDGRRMALIAASVMTTYHFHIHWSRLALNNIWDSLWVPLVLAAFAWGWKRRWSGGAVISGLALGLSQYFYGGSKVAFFLLALLVFQMWRGDRDGRRLGVHLSKLAATAICAAAPLGFFAVVSPELYLARIPQVMGWTPEAIRQVTGAADGWWAYLGHQVTHTFGAFLFYPDVTGFYHPGIAFTFGVSALAFALGVLWAVRTRRWLPLAWLLVTTLLGGFVMQGAPSSSHYVVSIPAIVWLIAMPLDALIQRGWWKLAVSWLALIMLSDLLFYFAIYVPRSSADLTVPFPRPAAPPG